MPLAMWDIKEGIMEVESEGVGGFFSNKKSALSGDLSLNCCMTSPEQIKRITCRVGERILDKKYNMSKTNIRFFLNA